MADNKIFIRIRRNSIEELLLWYGGRRASAAKVLRVVFFCGTDYVGQIHDLCSSTVRPDVQRHSSVAVRRLGRRRVQGLLSY